MVILGTEDRERRKEGWNGVIGETKKLPYN